MNQSAFSCPHCQQPINLETSFVHHVEQALARKYNQHYADQKAALQQQQAELRQQKLTLQRKEQEQQLEIQQAINAQVKAIQAEALHKARTEQEAMIGTLQAELRDKSATVKSLQQQELNLLRQQRELEEKQAALALDVEKQLRTERADIEAKALQKARDESYLKEEEQQGLIRSLTEQLHAMKRKIEQGSQQTQGEALEVALEKLLSDTFPFDQITEVSKGVNGADLIQDVRNEFGRLCGRIIYESKRTKAFGGNWIDKLKADQQRHNGDLAVLVTEAMPADMRHFGLMDGVWICTFAEVKALVSVLRMGVLKVSEVQTASENKGDKMQRLYDYLTGNEFQQCVRSIVRAFQAMQAGLDQEKRAMKKIWSQREKQIEAVIDSTTSMVGAIGGIAEGVVLDMPELELLADDVETAPKCRTTVDRQYLASTDRMVLAD
ncbi:DUF2130 domain-containing protein [Fibrisoma montanum]|uniref:DUF2130 domain-containing protein n=1 Tax=Fibrisoma montanum TaxID=2305895 RepID=A0A418MFH1_9BACT|nr:DUF2130 domain-containing protein [Fibrisoma montanum]RIV25473.1 DUF2130 domain-containing protein [Fibrisoma montanum]